MNPRIKHLAALAVLGTLGIIGPVASASAATPASARFALPLPAVAPGGFGSVGGLGEVGGVIGPIIITTAPTMFVNTNNQVTMGGAVIGAQVATP